MTQLILDTTGYNLVLPESVKGGYVVEEQALSVDVEMITGRIVRQLRGNAWHITYQYGLFDDELIAERMRLKAMKKRVNENLEENKKFRRYK